MEKVMRGWWVLVAPTALILALLADIGLPTLFPVLRQPWVRLALIAAVALVFGGIAAWRYWRGRKASDSIAAEISTPSPADVEGEVLAARMREALGHLRGASGKRRDYLYQQPWYVMIGPPGAGKTTALAASGIRFPWTDIALKGAGGTRNLDFWFAEDAVLVDTAGRYTTQDSDPGADAAGWEKFLRLLRRSRPLEPINGVLVTIGLDELMAGDRDRIDRHAAAIRRRLIELRRTLAVLVPVYLIVSKADLLAGFGEYFADLDAEGRRAVLGATLDPASAADGASLVAAFDGVCEAVRARMAKRLQDEPDQRRRSLILAFPEQLASLRARFARLVDGIFPAEGEPAQILRGVYLSSGTQEGAPLDRVLSAMAAVYEEPQMAGVGPGRGRAFFLNRLFRETIFPEAGMVRGEAAVRRRRRAILAGGIGGLVLLGLVATGLWGVSFARNRALQTDLLAGGQQIAELGRDKGIDLATVRDGDPDLEQALPLLDRLRALPRGYQDQLDGGPPMLMRLGLYQSGHAGAARQAYLEALQRIMLSRILLRLEDVLRAHQQQPDQLYEPLKAYLMLGGHGALDRRAVRAWVVEDWRTAWLAGPDRSAVRAGLARHLDAMLADPDLGRVWPGRRAPLDGALIGEARAGVQSLPLADRAYSVLRQRAIAAGRPDWRADAVLASGDARAFRNGATVFEMRVPWFFTRDGYTHAFQPGLADVEAELGRDLWVLGPDAAKESIRGQVPALRAAVAAAYARDYVRAWDAVLTTPQPADYFADRAALGAFSRTPSPLKTLLAETRRNTHLGEDRAHGAGYDAGRAITDHFRTVADFAGGPVDELVQAVRQAASATAAAATPGAGPGSEVVQGQMASAMGGLSTAGVVAPPQLQSFVAQASRRGRGAATKTAADALEQQYAQAIRPACLSASRDLYPFAPGSTQDAAVAALQRVYGNGGDVDDFVRARLQPLLDTGTGTGTGTGMVWRWRAADPVAALFAPASATQFQRAAAVRDLIAGGLALDVSLVSLGKDVDAVDVMAGGTSYRLTLKAPGPQPLVWAGNAVPQAHAVLLAGSRELRRDETRGSWALFRLLDTARRQEGDHAILATFGSGAQSAVLRIQSASSARLPLAGTGAFAFRCPERL